MKLFKIKIDPAMKDRLKKARLKPKKNEEAETKTAAPSQDISADEEDSPDMKEAKRRSEEMKQNPSVVKSGKDLKKYLKKRGVKIKD